MRLLPGTAARGRREAITRPNTSHEYGKAIRPNSPVKKSMDGLCIPQLPGIVRQGQ